ncbi:holin [Streptomyces sp. XD-27]|uniref:holin n=1 Tax=Streptomyces sp. XD-27 TaxID=3062779 RepID=UPI0026F437B6|nr:holin [Streptomyces sp. XD-27]WKX70019.1 holin [Streptomyces sp. XD-27]
MANKVERKVTWATLGGLAAGAAVTLLNATVGDAELMGSLPSALQYAITLVAPPLITFLSGYAAPHTPRPADASS